MTHTGLTVTMAISHARLALVKSLLEQVAERAGFASARHMRRIWVRQDSQTPTDFRQAARASKTAL